MRRGSRGALGVVIAACVLLCGCSPARVDSPVASALPTPSATPAVAAWADSSELPDLVTFADGTGLRSGSWRVAWNQTGLWGGGYMFLLATEGQPPDEGLWNYTQSATGCDIMLLQDQDVAESDDLSATDASLAKFSDMDAATLADLVFESTASISGVPSNLQFHSVAGKREGASEHAAVYSTRVLAAADAELSMSIECPEGVDAITAANLLLDDVTVDIRRPDEPVDFEASAEVVQDNSIWEDSAIVDGDWTLTTPDDGGAWGYTSTDSDCTVNFEQTRVGEADRAMQDDRVLTDRMLASFVSWSEDEVGAAAKDGTFGYGPSSNRIIPTRVLEGDDGGRSWTLTARAFRQSGLGFLVDVWCTQRDPADALAEILTKSSVVPPGW